MSGGFAIRRALPADYEDLADIFRRSIREVAARHYNPAQIETWATGPLDWNGRMGNRIVLVAEAQKRLLGFVQYDPPDHIDMTYVHPDHLRKGVACALLAALEAEARARKVAVLHVEASITSQPFFVSRGYELLTPQIVRVRGQDFLNYRMMKRIG
jgi:putative acetyltransferase